MALAAESPCLRPEAVRGQQEGAAWTLEEQQKSPWELSDWALEKERNSTSTQSLTQKGAQSSTADPCLKELKLSQRHGKCQTPGEPGKGLMDRWSLLLTGQ